MSAVTHVVRSSPPLSAVAALLEESGLPAADLTNSQLKHFFFLGPAGSPNGVVGIELCGEHALLRSLAVRETERGSGLGSLLVAHAEGYARTHGAKAMYLLTTTADRFFERHGYAAAPRDDAPDEIRRTTEFAEICPASSVFMIKRL